MGLFSRRQNDAEDTASKLAPAKNSRRASAREAGEPLDPAESQKRRARRRLIGATVLVLGVIVFLPMVFDPGPKPLNDDIVVQIPDKDSAFHPVAPKAPGRPPEGSAAGAVTVPPVAPAAPAGKGEPPKAEAVTPTAPATPTPPAAKAEAPKAEVAKAPAKAEPSRSDPAKPADGNRAQALLDGKSAPAVAKAEVKPADATVKPEGWAVQIGAFTSAERVKDLRDKLTTAGLKSYVETVKTPQGDRIRVRVGPFPTKDAAEKARERVKKHLVIDGSVVAA